MKKITLTCDCGCGLEIKKNNPFVLSKKEIPGPMGADFNDLKIRGKLHFLNLEHLSTWIKKAVEAAPVLKKRIDKDPQFRGSTFDRAVPQLYV